MGYLMKEALKTLCGVNQWAYAVFWKIGCQNPKLLIWEECYYEFGPCSGLPGAVGVRDKVHSLVNRMMIDSYVNVIGEGLVGRVAFTGNYHWMISQNCYQEAHPPDVLKEACQQFSAGMQTIAVIPVLPHGVVQFGSFLTIAENVSFVNDVTSLLLQLGYASVVLPSEEFAVIGNDMKLGVPEYPNNSAAMGLSEKLNVNESPYFLNNPNYVGKTSQASVGDIQTSFSVVREIRNEMEITPMNAVAKAEVIPSNSGMWMNHSTIGSTEKKIFSDAGDPCSFESLDASVGFQIHSSGLKRASAKSHERCKGTAVDMQAKSSVDFFSDMKWTAESNAACIPSESGDGLFDVLGADFKNKFFRYGSTPRMHRHDNINLQSMMVGSEICSTSQGNSESGIFSAGADNLLEAVVSKVHSSGKRSLDDNVPSRTTLTSTSSSPAPSTSLPYGRFAVSDPSFCGVSEYQAKAGATGSCSLTTELSQGSSGYGSQKAKANHSASTSHSKKPEETGKTSRRRLKPGENPRPRPKDRQMIQDRVKELREFVPNGAKCSIDALLERTIKHMLFLQSVTMHADKLNQAGESKIVGKNGGLLLTDNLEGGGGATWAYEVGSQSMVCPIIVEDLNQPRQMHVEMLCEERGLFLEIADVIKGLGLTILKGVMEILNDKIWARFAVEANRDVTRMEIFISLVRLLGQSAGQLNRISNENVEAAFGSGTRNMQ